MKHKLTVVEGRDVNIKMVEFLEEAALKRGWDFRRVSFASNETIAENKLDKLLTEIVVWRDFNNMPLYDNLRARYWASRNCKCVMNVNEVGGFSASSSKYFQHGLFSNDPEIRDHVLPMYRAISKENVLSLINRGKLKYPFLLKPSFGTTGKGIILVKEEKDMDLCENWWDMATEPYINSKYNWRVFVIGGVGVGVMRKTGDEKDERNFTARSSGETRELEDDIENVEEIKRIAEHAAVACGLENSGVDIMRDDDTGKFYVAETNITAGWQNGFGRITGVDVADEYCDWLEEKYDALSQSKYESIKKYFERRLKYLPEMSQRIFARIMNGRDNPENCEYDGELINRLVWAYRKLKNVKEPGELFANDRVRIADLINQVENMKLSKLGNYIGGDESTLDSNLLVNAYYLSIYEKYDKIVGVN